ncbi:hypothetical protein DY000_02010363 [Brassica cretica]|uniref:Coatomer WD associated region domain-containing protein n=1 Tax=Brassica cretica TaxID=69181 RepID=A0ABQ7BWL4_BRACR|nr:hypothetical protein DY000_02010363 [Brassica cretica]
MICLVEEALRLEIKKIFAQKSERVNCVDLHPTEPWILASLHSGTLCVWIYQTQVMAKSFRVTNVPVRSAKFIARKQWVVAGADDKYIRVYNYNTMAMGTVKDWEKGWACTQIFKGHSHSVMQVTFNPKDTNTFASAHLIIWNLGSPDPNFTLDAHQKGLNCVDYFTGGDKPYLITGSDDHTAKVCFLLTVLLDETFLLDIMSVYFLTCCITQKTVLVIQVWCRSTVGCAYRSTTKFLRRAMWNVDLYGWCVPSEQDHLRTAIRSAKFIARKQWVVAGADDLYIRVYNYNTMDTVKVFEAHSDYIRCVAVHPTLPYVLSSSDDMVIKLWDWEKGWACTQIFEGHSHYVMQVTFNPKDTNTFASASLDRTIKIWNLGSPDPNFTLDAHQKGVNCVDYFTGGDKPYLITGSDDHTAKVWDYQTKSCVQTLDGHTHNVSAVCFHPELPIIITGSEDGTVRIWHATTYRLENTLNYGLERVWAIGYIKSSRRVVIGYDEGTIMVKLGREIPVASMDNTGKIIWAKHNEIQTANIKSIGADYEVTDGERLPLAVKELGTCDLYPQSLKHNPNGRFVVVCGDGEYIIYTALAWRNRSFGSGLEFVWSSEGECAVRESSTKIKTFSKNFQEKRSIRPTFSVEKIFGGALLAMCSNDFICFYDWADCRLIQRIDVTVKNLYWADSDDLVAIASDTSFYILKYNRELVSSHFDSGRSTEEEGVEDAFEVLHENDERVRTGIWVGDCFIYNNASWKLNYCVGGEVTTMYHLDRPMYLLGYLANQSRVFLVDKEFNVIGYTLLLSLIEYKTLVMRGDLAKASEILPTIPKDQHNNVAHFLESRGMVEEALEAATDPDYRFELAIQLARLDIAQVEIAVEAQSESKWKQLGELAMSSGKLQMAEECMKYAMDLSGLLLLYSSIGDAEGASKLATLAKEQGKNNVAYLCLFMLGKLEDCLDLLVESNRIPEAALMARSYLPSKVSEIVALWRKDLSKVFFPVILYNRIPEAALMARSYLPSKVSEIVALWRKDLSKINSKAAESLADPEEYSNLFEDWQVALSVEAKSSETRGVYTAAENYPSHADRSSMTLVEAFRNLQVEEEESLENGDIEHEEEEVAEENGDEEKNDEDVEEQHDEQQREEVVDGDSTDGAVLVNGSEADEDAYTASVEITVYGNGCYGEHSSSKNAFTGLASTEASGSLFSFGSTSSVSLFGFGLSNRNNPSVFGATGSSIVKKSEGSGFPTKQEVSTETGEENEKVAFSAESFLFEYLDGGWRERGATVYEVVLSVRG